VKKAVYEPSFLSISLLPKSDTRIKKVRESLCTLIQILVRSTEEVNISKFPVMI
jgi:hypothetical protein